MDYNKIQEFEKQKTKVMNYIIYKKRTEYEVRQKFSKIIDEGTLEEIIEYVKEVGYLSDKDYIERVINEFMALKNLSIFEIKNKLYAKGISKDDIEAVVGEKIARNIIGAKERKFKNFSRWRWSIWKSNK